MMHIQQQEIGLNDIKSMLNLCIFKVATYNNTWAPICLLLTLMDIDLSSQFFRVIFFKGEEDNACHRNPCHLDGH